MQLNQPLGFRSVCRILFAMLALVTVIACSDTEHEPASELNTWLDTQYQTERLFSPMQLSRMNDRRLHGDLDEVTDEALAERLAWKRASVEQLRERFVYKELTVEEQISYDLWVYQYEQLTRYAQVRSLEYVFEPVMGPHLALPQFLIDHHDAPTMQYMGDYNRRIRVMGTRLEQWLAIAKARAQQGVRPPKFAYLEVIQQAQQVVSGAPFDDTGDSLLWQDAQEKATALLERGRINERGMELILNDTRVALSESLAPAYHALLEWLHDDLANAEANPVGISRHEGGSDYYDYLLAYHANTELSAEEVHQLGLRHVARIRQQIEAMHQTVNMDSVQQELDTLLAPLFEELQQAARAVVDTGLHAKQWTLQQAIDYLEETTPLPSEVARAEVEHAMVMPGAAVGCFIRVKNAIETVPEG